VLGLSGPIPARVVEQDGRILLDKQCPAHGRQVELLEEDASWYHRRLDFDQPGTDSLRQTPVRDGCPFDCGLCPEHEQHSCIGLVEVTGACDLVCPTCYAAAGSGPPVPHAEVSRAVDAFVAAEGGEAEILQVSGGEPTTHPEIVEILRDARRRPLRYLMLNTNGLRLASDEHFADQLAKLDGRFEVYLQLDSLRGESSRALRGADLLERKLLAVRRLAEREIPVTLVATVAAGVNDGDLGDLLAFGLETPGVRGLNLQPLA